MSGKVYTAEELHRLGVVDVLAEDGQGENAVRDYVSLATGVSTMLTKRSTARGGASTRSLMKNCGISSTSGSRRR